jgi:hypothetical protein
MFIVTVRYPWGTVEHFRCNDRPYAQSLINWLRPALKHPNGCVQLTRVHPRR